MRKINKYSERLSDTVEGDLLLCPYGETENTTGLSPVAPLWACRFESY